MKLTGILVCVHDMRIPALGSPGAASQAGCVRSTTESSTRRQSQPPTADRLPNGAFQCAQAESSTACPLVPEACLTGCAFRNDFRSSSCSVTRFRNACPFLLPAELRRAVMSRPVLGSQPQVYLLRQRQCRADMHASQLCAAAGGAGRRCQVGGTANRVGRVESGGTQVHLHGRNGRKVPEVLEGVCWSNRWLSILFWTASTQLAKYKVAGPVDSHVPVYNCLPTVCNCLRLSTEGRCYLHLSTLCR